MKENPFPRLTKETKRSPENARLLDELGAYFESVLRAKPRDKNYGFYEYIGTSKDDSEKSETE